MDKSSVNKVYIRSKGQVQFIFALLVVFIHTYSKEYAGSDAAGDYSIFIAARDLVAAITSVAVPGFFLTSGYLFFNGVDEWNIATYYAKIKRRMSTLLLPFLIWNALKLTELCLSAAYSNGKEGIYNVFEQYGWWRIFWDGNPVYDSPILLATWFVRDLIVFCIFTPIIYYAVRYTKYLLPIVLLICSAAGWWSKETVCGINGMAFFVLGSTLAINKVDMFAPSSIQALIALAFVCISQVFMVAFDAYYLKEIYALAAIIAIIYMCNKWMNLPEHFTKSTPLIYFGHSFLTLSCIHSALLCIIPADNQYAMLARYILTPILTIFVIVMINYLLTKRMPIILFLLTGKR